ncbi:MAG: histidine kinase dimerization/phospho-acceptor domain-containing protein, partial [Dehalococcoidia bacterium]
MQRRLHAALRDAATATFAIDTSGVITWAEGELAGVAVDQFVGTSYRHRFESIPAAAKAVRHGQAGEIVQERTRWGQIDLDLRVRPIFDANGQVTEVVVALVDVSAEVREIERAERLAHFRSELLAMINQRLRAPLNGVSGMTELLLAAHLPPRQQEWAALAHASGDAILDFVDDLVDFAELDAGRVTLARESFSLRETIESVLAARKPKAQARGVSLVLRYALDCSEDVVGDRRRVRTVVDTLVALAIDSADEGHMIVNVDEADPQLQRVALHISVDLDRALPTTSDPPPLGQGFAAASDLRSAGFSETALALAVSEGIVELMDGRLSFTSLPGRGMAFSLRLQLPRATPGDGVEPSPSGPRWATRTTVSASAASGRILLVGSDPLQQRAMKQMLASLGHEVVLVSLPADAATALDAATYDAVIANDLRPVSAVRSLTAAIRGRLDRQSSPPIIAVTADAMRGSMQRHLDAGVDDYLSKPVRLETLRCALASWITTGASSQPAPPEDRAALDLEELSRLCALEAGGGTNALAELIDLFLAGAPTQMLRIRDAVQRRDAAALRAELEPFQTSCRLLGAAQLQEFAEKLRTAGDADNEVHSRQLLTVMERDFKAVCRDLARLRSEQNPRSA